MWSGKNELAEQRESSTSLQLAANTAAVIAYGTATSVLGCSQARAAVLLVLVHGESNQGIAEQLGISARTVGHHVQHVYEKAGVRRRAAAKLWAFEYDLVSRP